jgi:hypothetical protein
MTNLPSAGTPTPFRAIRESTGLTLRAVAKRVIVGGKPMNPGRLSVIERGLPPSEEERAALMAVLMEAVR